MAQPVAISHILTLKSPSETTIYTQAVREEDVDTSGNSSDLSFKPGKDGQVKSVRQ